MQGCVHCLDLMDLDPLQVRERFEKAGGRVHDFAAAEGVKVHPDGVSLVMPDSSPKQSLGGNGAPTSSNGATGQASLQHSIITEQRQKPISAEPAWHAA